MPTGCWSSAASCDELLLPLCCCSPSPLIPAALALQSATRRRARRYAVRFTAVATLRARRRPELDVAPPTAARRCCSPRSPRSPSRWPARTSTYRAAGRPGLDDARHRPLRLDGGRATCSRPASPPRQRPPTRSSTSSRSGARVGAVTFSSSPDAVQAPVTDHGAARSVIDAQTADGATATGDALALALQLLHGTDTKHPPSAIVLLSDGAANTGVDPVNRRPAGGAGQDPDLHGRPRAAGRDDPEPGPARPAGRRLTGPAADGRRSRSSPAGARSTPRAPTSSARSTRHSGRSSARRPATARSRRCSRRRPRAAPVRRRRVDALGGTVAVEAALSDAPR